MSDYQEPDWNDPETWYSEKFKQMLEADGVKPEDVQAAYGPDYITSMESRILWRASSVISQRYGCKWNEMMNTKQGREIACGLFWDYYFNSDIDLDVDAGRTGELLQENM